MRNPLLHLGQGQGSQLDTSLSMRVKRALRLARAPDLELDPRAVATYSITDPLATLNDSVVRGGGAAGRASALGVFGVVGLANPAGSGRALIVVRTWASALVALNLSCAVYNGAASALAAAVGSALTLDRSGIFRSRGTLATIYWGDTATSALGSGGTIGTGLIDQTQVPANGMRELWSDQDTGPAAVLWEDEHIFWRASVANTSHWAGFQWFEVPKELLGAK